MGGLGVGRRGSRVLGFFLENSDVQFVAICDARAQQRKAVKELADKANGNEDCQMYTDMEEFLGRTDIDALLIATGDRWHTMASILAAKAGKDIYCEKPCSMTIAESRALSDTITRYQRIYQAGTQRRNGGNFMWAVELALTGKLGKLHTLHANTLDPKTTHDWLPAEPEPPKDEVDWDWWLGPSPWRPYNSKYIEGKWRGYFDFHGGGILEWGSHTVDLCQWANQADETTPIEFVPSGQEVHCNYANGVKLVMRVEGWLDLGTCCVRFEGDEGWVETGDSGKMAFSPNLKSFDRTFEVPGTNPGAHVREFLDCVKSRNLPKSHATTAAQGHVACHAAHIAWQLGRELTFDPVKEEFLRDVEANRMRSRAMREPYRI
jgi:predicted dehydrogenase